MSLSFLLNVYANVLDPINTVTFVFHNLYVQWLAISNPLEITGNLNEKNKNCCLKLKQKQSLF